MGFRRGGCPKLVARYHAEGEAAFEPRSRRPGRSPNRTPSEVVDLIVELRVELTSQGLDAGADTIAWHLQQHHQIRVSPATVWRYLKAHGLVESQPKKRPKSSYVRFEAAMPNETWQADFTHWRLADGSDIEILTFLDDHSRYALSVTAHQRITGPAVLAEFRAAISRYGQPASTLTDNGMVSTTRLAGGRGGRNSFETELGRLGIIQKNSRPNHPTTVGKVERFQQTLKRWLRNQPPSRHHQPPTSPHRHLRRHLQQPPTPPLPPTNHPSRRIPAASQSHPDQPGQPPLPDQTRHRR